MLKKVYICAVTMAAFTASSLYGATADLPRTGQISCYDGSGNKITCTGTTGQDGDLQKGIAWPNTRFTNADGTAPVTGAIVVDHLTGLMWLRDGNCMKTYYSGFDADGTAGDGMVTWQHALDFVAGINAGTYANCQAGYSDWRLPNVNELESLFNYETTMQYIWLNGQGFLNVKTMYWSSTTYAGFATFAWLADTVGGSLLMNYLKSATAYVWLVRGGQ